MTNATNKISA